MDMNQQITPDDIRAVRGAIEALLHEGTKRLGSSEHKEKYLGAESLIDLARQGELVGGTTAIRRRAMEAYKVVEKLESRLAVV